MIRKILAGVLLFVFVISSVLFYTVIVLYLTVFNKDFYSSDEFAAYSYDLALSELPKYFNGNLPEGFSSEYVSGVIKKYITAAELKPLIADFERQISEAIKIGGNRVFTLDLGVFRNKRNLIVEEFANHLVGNLNTCVDSSVYVLENPRCIPSGISKNDFIRQFKSTLDRKLFSQVPDQFKFSLNLPSVEKSGLFELSYLLVYVYLSVLIILLILVGLLIFKPFVRILKWIMFGILSSLILFSIFVFVPTVLPIKTIPAVFHLLFGKVYIYFFILIFVFLVLFVWTVISDKKQSV